MHPSFHSRRWRCAAVLITLLVAAACSQPGVPGKPSAAGCGTPRAASLHVPGYAGMNYGAPLAVDGRWLGTEWLTPGDWEQARPRFAADLDYVHQQHLGTVVRLFFGLDQAIRWGANGSYQGLDGRVLANFDDAMQIVRSEGLEAFVVLYDQESVASRGNFHFEALDGNHDRMRAGYLRATATFMQHWGSTPGVVGWDLFNEAYNSLSSLGGLPKPPHPDPVSPGYSEDTVHHWIVDLYHAAKCASPDSALTVSDGNMLYRGSGPDLTAYAGAVDYYDVHIYDDSPALDRLRGLNRPFILGEVGASINGRRYLNQADNAPVVAYVLAHGREAGAAAVLAQGGAGTVFASDRKSVLPTGEAVARYAS